MVPIFLFALLSTTQTPPLDSDKMQLTPELQTSSRSQAGGLSRRSGYRKTDGVLAHTYVTAARQAHQNPGDVAAQLKAARYAFALLHIVAPSRQRDLARSIYGFGKSALALAPESAEAQLWLGVGLGEVAVTYDFFASPSLREKYEAALRSSMALNADCLSGLARLHMARMYAQPTGHFGADRAARAGALLRGVQRKFPGNPLPAVYLTAQPLPEGRPGRMVAGAERGQVVRPSTLFEHLMLLATSEEEEAADPRLFALLDHPM